MDRNKIWKKLAELKYPLLILAIGVLFLLVPSGGAKTQAQEQDLSISQILSEAKGLGETKVLVSEHGVIVVCEGAADASVKLDILHAVASYTGYGSDKITILTRKDHE